MDSYAYRLRTHTSTALTADQIHRTGLEQVTRIEGQMDALVGEQRSAALFDLRPEAGVVVRRIPEYAERNAAADYTLPARDGFRYDGDPAGRLESPAGTGQEVLLQGVPW